MKQLMFEREIQVLGDTFRRLMRRHAHTNLVKLINKTHPADMSVLFRYFDESEQEQLFDLMQPNDHTGEFLTELDESILQNLVAEVSADRIAKLIDPISASDRAEILSHLPDEQSRGIIDLLKKEEVEELEEILAYPEDSAGGLMNTDTITVRPDITLEVVLRYLRRHRSLPDMTDNLLVVNRRDEFIGLLVINKILVSDTETTVREVMETDIITINANMEDTGVARLFERHDLISAPVVDEYSGKLLGRITIDDVVDVIREDADHSLMSMAGLDEDEDTFAPALKSSRRRAVWLGINLLTAFLASAVIGLFEATIEQVVALAVLMPIVASMGGVAGSQTLTLIIRGQAVGHIDKSNVKWLLSREFLVGATNGLLWAVVVATATYIWFNDLKISIIIAAAIIINLVVAVMAGAFLPIWLKRLKIDPALAGSVLLTTITDVVGFFAFLGLAASFYF